MRLPDNERTVTRMAEYIEKWPIVNRLIDIENEFQQYKPFHGFEHAMYRKICEAEIAIGKTQAADVAPVRHGRWLTWEEQFPGSTPKKQSGLGVFCDKCHSHADNRTDYCPNCGAKMMR